MNVTFYLQGKSIYIDIRHPGIRLRKPIGKKCLTKIDGTNIEGDKRTSIYLNKIKIGLEEFEFDCTKNRTLLTEKLVLEEFNKILNREEPVSKFLEEEKVVVQEKGFLEAFQDFIEAMNTGSRKTKKGKVMTVGTIKNYKSTLKSLKEFAQSTGYVLSWKNINDKFYDKYTSYLWDDLDLYDNLVGGRVKNIKTFLNWCVDEKIIPDKLYTNKWIKWTEEIDIVVIYPDEMVLLSTMEMPSEKMDRTRDIFLMGCMTCFRVSNLLSLTKNHLVIKGSKWSLKTISVKTGQPLFINLNEIGKKIISKYMNKYKTLLPEISDANLNLNLKELAQYFQYYLSIKKEELSKNFVGNNWAVPFVKNRYKRGKAIQVSEELSELISTHTMRRTGITNLLMLGLSEIEVKSISGHSFSSKDFAKYVKIAEQFIDRRASDAWETLLG